MKTRAVRSMVIALVVSALVAVPGVAEATDPPPGAAVTVTGRVLDAGGSPIANASVHASGVDAFTLTDATGAYTLTNVPQGSAMVIAAKEGYAFDSTVRHGTTGVNVTLSPETAPPRGEYPRPDSDRRPFNGDRWLSLNGTWSFDFDQSGVGEAQNWFSPSRSYGKAIRVPFVYESLAAFGEEELATDDHFASVFGDRVVDSVWYRKSFTVPSDFSGRRSLLRIGAVYWGASVWLDGAQVLPFTDLGESELSVDLGALTPGSTHTLVIRAKTPAVDQAAPYPQGRRDRFTPASGIWQSVWIEAVRTERITDAWLQPNVSFTGTSRTPSSASVAATITATGAAGKTAQVTVTAPDGSAVGTATASVSSTGSATVSIPITDPELWDIGEPNLYTADVVLKDGSTVLDGSRNTFGLRKVERKLAPASGADYQYVYLNNRPIFIRGVLDQAFNPWGLFTPTGQYTGADFTTGTEASPARGSIQYDLKAAVRDGFNLVRAHVKVMEPSYYHLADKLGLLVWAEMPNPGRSSFGATARGYFENLLRASVVRDRNHPSIVLQSIYNEGWGIAGGPNPIAPAAVPHVIAMTNLARSLNPRMLVDDNSACCENGHTSATDINDFHAGYTNYNQFKTMLDDFSAAMSPGSTKNFDEGSQSGQPWFVGEMWLGRGAQPHVTSLMRAYNKLSGYVHVQIADQEDEIVSQLSYDRWDRGAQFLDHKGAARGLDLFNTDDAVVLLNESSIAATPGSTLSLPVRISHFSDKDLSGATLKWKIAGRDERGAWSDPALGGTLSTTTPVRYAVTNQPSLSVTVPSSLRTGYIWVWLEKSGQTLAENLVSFSAAATVSGGLDPLSPLASSTWSGGTSSWAMCGPQENVGLGVGSFEYKVPISAAVASSGGTLQLEVSSAESPNPNNLIQPTGARKFPTSVTVSVDGTPLRTIVLPDDPWDARGIAAREYGRFKDGVGNHYGYPVSVTLPASLTSGKSALNVTIASSGGGLRVFGIQAGKGGISAGVSAAAGHTDVPSFVAGVDDRPSVSIATPALSATNTGTVVVSVVNDSTRTLGSVKAELTLPSGWTASPQPSGAQNIGSLGAGEYRHVSFTVAGPSGLAAGTAVAATARATWTEGGRSAVTQAFNSFLSYANPFVSHSAGTGSSLSGDAKAEMACVSPGGNVMGWMNGTSFSSGLLDWTGSWTTDGRDTRTLATGMTGDPARVKFADLDGDGKKEIIYVKPDGDVVAWKNTQGFGASPWGSSVTIANGMTHPERVFFTDLDGDGKSEILLLQGASNSDVVAWRNGAGFAAFPWVGSSVVVATGFGVDGLLFADLDGDRKSDILNVAASGTVTAWRNGAGFAPSPWTGSSVVVATGMVQGRVGFPDLDGDGKADVISTASDGRVIGWRNGAGFAAAPWTGPSVVVADGVTSPERLRFP